MVSNNRLQFVGRKFEGLLQELHVQHCRTSVGHPQDNGQVEVINITLLNESNVGWKMLKASGPKSFYMFYGSIGPPLDHHG